VLDSLIVGVVRLLCGASVHWIGSRPEDRQRIYFANHTSHLDSVLLWSVLPREVRSRTRPVAARDYWTRGRLRQILATSVLHAVLIERRKVSARDHPLLPLLEALDQGASLILFPEGTRGSGTGLLPFKSGLFHLARRRPAVEMIPVFIENLNRILPKGEILAVPLLCSVSFGEPLSVRSGEDKHSFLRRARDAISRMQSSESSC